MFRVSGSNVFGTHVIPGLREPGTFRRFLTSRGSFSAATTSSYRKSTTPASDWPVESNRPAVRFAATQNGNGLALNRAYVMSSPCPRAW